MSEYIKPRPHNKQTFDDNFDRIFGHGEDKGSDSEDELMNYEDNFASGLWEYQEHPPCTLPCNHCDKKTEYVFTWVWKNLTDEQILDALEVSSAEAAVFRIARAVEAQLKEKNTRKGE